MKSLRTKLKEVYKPCDVWILATRRTGSTLIQDLLNSLDSVSPKFRERTSNYLANNIQYPINSKVFPDHMAFYDRTIPGLLEARPDIKFIHIRREDAVAEFVSNCMVGKTKIWHFDQFVGGGYDDAIHNNPFDFNKPWLEKQFLILQKDRKFWPELIKKYGLTTLELVYEDLLSNPIKEFKKVLSFIDRPLKGVKKIMEGNKSTILHKKYEKEYEEIRELVKTLDSVKEYEKNENA